MVFFFFMVGALYTREAFGYKSITALLVPRSAALQLTHVTLGLLNGNEVLWDGRFLGKIKGVGSLLPSFRAA